MLDATDYKKLVRVVDVVLLRLCAQGAPGKILIETQELWTDGRGRSIARLPGSKKEPHENSRETARRVLSEMLNTSEVTVVFDFEDSEIFEEENDSPSYPTVRTVYRKEIVTGMVMTTPQPLASKKLGGNIVLQSDAECKNALAKIGLPTGSDWNAEDSKKNIKFFAWMRESQALAKNIKLRAGSVSEVSGLVMAPTGLNEDDLSEFLRKHGVDPGQYGCDNSTMTLRDFSSELVRGESSLVEGPNGEPFRVVELVMLKIVDPTTGDILIELERNLDDGVKQQLKRLPGYRQRPDENQFLTAKRVLRKQLKIHEHQVKLSPQDVQYFDEVREIPGYVVKTVLRKRLITAELDRRA
jgi:hypothetical protein